MRRQQLSVRAASIGSENGNGGEEQINEGLDGTLVNSGN